MATSSHPPPPRSPAPLGSSPATLGSSPAPLGLPTPVVAAYGRLGLVEAHPLTAGLINQTWCVRGDDGGRFILQRVNPIFEPEPVHANIAAVTGHLRACGLVTPELTPTDAGAPYFATPEVGCWRVLTFVEGATLTHTAAPARLASAGRLVGRFHRALATLETPLVVTRVGVHDTPAHLARLRAAMASGRDHRLHARVATLADEVLRAAEALSPLPDAPDEPGHGDLKLSNLLFRGDEAVCLVDLDTLAPMARAHELGDAFRSWCLPRGEDAPELASFSVPSLAAAWGGYAEGLGRAPTALEREAALVGVEHICLELTARFLADALVESYFGWDPTRFSTRGDHNLARARGQWSLFTSARHQRAARRAALDGP